MAIVVLRRKVGRSFRVARRIAVVAALSLAPATSAIHKVAGCKSAAVTLAVAGGRHRLQLEIADDPYEHARGLMGRGALAEDGGMLFVYPAPRRVRFWMKGAKIALDLLFFDAEGHLTRLHENAVPGRPHADRRRRRRRARDQNRRRRRAQAWPWRECADRRLRVSRPRRAGFRRRRDAPRGDGRAPPHRNNRV